MPISQIFDCDLFSSLLHIDERFYTPVFINIIDDTTSNCLKVPTISLWRVSWIIVSSNGFNNVSNRKAISSFVFHHGRRRFGFCNTSIRVFMVEGVKSWLGSHIIATRQFSQRSAARAVWRPPSVAPVSGKGAGPCAFPEPWHGCGLRTNVERLRKVPRCVFPMHSAKLKWSPSSSPREFLYKTAWQIMRKGTSGLGGSDIRLIRRQRQSVIGFKNGGASIWRRARGLTKPCGR